MSFRLYRGSSVPAAIPRLSSAISYEFDTYKKFSLAFYTVLMGYADELQAVSVDEALVDVTGAVAARAMAPEEARELSPTEDDHIAETRLRDPALELADKIRAEVRNLTDGCEGT